MKPRTRTWRPYLEILEDRSTPSTFAAFDLGAPESGPFPSDRFTVADSSQLTGRRVNLALPDRATHPSDYDDVSVINTLDGFNLQPRLSIAFSGPIDVTTVNSSTVFLIKLGDPTAPEEGGGRIVGINQIVWDVATNSLHVESDELLEQHTRYALIVTRGVRDADGLPVEPSEAFERFRHDLNFGQTADPDLGEYREDLLGALSAAEVAGVKPKDVGTASVFTTMSATAVLEKIRDHVHAATPEPADFLLGPGGTRMVFSLDTVSGITFNRQTAVDPPVLSPVAVNLAALRLFPGAVGTIAFGKYLSPDYLVHQRQFIPAVGTRTGTPEVLGTNEIYFNVILPSGATPAGGWPVAIYSSGINGNKNEWLPFVAASMASRGIATMAINAVGIGYGPLSTLTVNQTGGSSATFIAGGRAFDQNGDGTIPNFEGVVATGPMTIIGQADALRQTAVDLMQLVRVTEAGMDVDGDGAPDLDPSRVYFFGNSLGGENGTIFFAVEPDVHAGVLNVPGGTALDFTNTTGRRSVEIGGGLASRTPSLINSPGITSIDGVPVAGPNFNENLPLMDGLPLKVGLADGTSLVIQSPVINTVAGAMAIQEALENREWVHMIGDPVSYAPHLRKDPLVDVPAKSVIIQFAKGDQNVTNPRTTALLRAGDLADRATLYRHDLASAENATLPRNPHQFLIMVNDPAVRPVALGYQSQIAAFFASDGEVVIHPEPSRFFETPIIGLLPEQPNFVVADAPIITIADAGVTEGNGGIRTLTFTVALTRASAQPVSVHYGTVDGAAKAGEDYEAASGTLVFASGETTKTITIFIKGDKEEEGKETFFIKLWAAENALLLDDLGDGTIFDDD
jgi:Calx-beta domain/Bacterial virulence factor lipase N-terminal